MPEPGDYPYPAEGTPEEQAEAFRAALEATAATALFESQAMSEEEDTTPALQILIEIWLLSAWADMCLLYFQTMEAGDPGTPSTLTALRSSKIIGPPSAKLLEALVLRAFYLRKALREVSRATSRGETPSSALTPEKAALTMANETWGLASEEIIDRIKNLDEDKALAESEDPEAVWIREHLPKVKGKKFYKRWVSRHDDKVRPLHRKLDGTSLEVGSGKDFWRWPETGQRLGFPGDPRAPLHTTINCRCVLAFHLQ